MANNPILLTDPNGMDWFWYSVDGKSDPKWTWHEGSTYDTGKRDNDGRKIIIEGVSTIFTKDDSADFNDFDGGSDEQTSADAGYNPYQGGRTASQYSASRGGMTYSSNMIVGDDGLNNNGNDPNDPMRGGRQNQRDQSIKRYPKDFQKWYHKEIKPDVHPGRDATPEELEEGYQDWLDHSRKTISTGLTWGLIGWGVYEGIKWGAGIILAPETGGGSLGVAGALP